MCDGAMLTAVTDDLGEPIATGRAADVYDLGDGTVLRRYRAGADTETEARAMTWLNDQGLPVPRVHRASGTDIVMDRAGGVTMLADLVRRPWRSARHARLLARLQRSVNSLAAPDWFPRRTGVPSGDSVLHLDLHPMNMLVDGDAATIIDWTNLSAGERSFDAAVSYVMMSAFETTGWRARTAQRVLVETFARAHGWGTIDATLGAAARYRLADPNVTAGERERLRRWIDRSDSESIA